MIKISTLIHQLSLQHSTTITDGQVKLVDGNSNSGRLEVYHNGIWGTVCDDGFTLDNARVVCRQLGFRSAIRVYCCGHYGYGSGRIWLDDVNCQGNESSIDRCNHAGWGSHNCGHQEDVGIQCSNGTKNYTNFKCWLLF